MTTEKNYYDILEVSNTATIDDIKKAYKKLALLYHPDKYKGDPTLFQQIHIAYEILSDVQKKKRV